MKKIWNAPSMEELNIQETACPTFGGPSYPSNPSMPFWPPFWPWCPTYPPCGGDNTPGNENTEFPPTDALS